MAGAWENASYLHGFGLSREVVATVQVADNRGPGKNPGIYRFWGLFHEFFGASLSHSYSQYTFWSPANPTLKKHHRVCVRAHMAARVIGSSRSWSVCPFVCLSDRVCRRRRRWASTGAAISRSVGTGSSCPRCTCCPRSRWRSCRGRPSRWEGAGDGRQVGQIGRQEGRLGRQTDRQTDGRTDGRAGGRAGMQTHRQADGCPLLRRSHASIFLLLVLPSLLLQWCLGAAGLGFSGLSVCPSVRPSCNGALSRRIGCTDHYGTRGSNTYLFR
jgi:hypothetical protein